MGCGYSTISGRRGRLRVRDRTQGDSDSIEGEYTCGFSPGKNRRAANRKAGSSTISDSPQKNGDVNSFNNEESLASRRRIANKIKPISGPMRPPINRSESQVDFFKMLDEKIANGKDLEEVANKDKTVKENHLCERLLPPASSLILVSSIESSDGLQESSDRSPSRSPSLQCNSSFKIGHISSSHKDIDKQHSDTSCSSVCPSLKCSFQDSSSLPISPSRSSLTSSKRPCFNNGITSKTEEDCHFKAENLDFTDGLQTNLNNGEILQDSAVKDPSSNKVTSPVRLSNGQVHS